MTALDEIFKDGSSVLLKPFGHQVGGHALLMKLDDKSLCKPVRLRELLFYNSLTEDLKKFTPKYHGKIRVRYEKTPGGEIVVLAKRGDGIGTPSRNSNGSLPQVPRDMKALFKCSTGLRGGYQGQNGHTVNGEYANPWSEKCLQTQTQQLSDCSYLDTITQDYLVLENLTSGLSCPCVLDLKMGTRQYGDDASDAKKAVFKERCAMSTSEAMGVRISGLQVYNQSKQQYTYQDKYYGRSLSREGLLQVLRSFVHDGTSYRTDVIPDIIHSLTDLREMIIRQMTYRFFSSSLLIIYDGDRLNLANGIAAARPPQVLIRMIDFVHTTCSLDSYHGDPVRYAGPDEGYLQGLTSLINAYQTHLDELN